MLRAAPFTYEQVGATASERPTGYDLLERSEPLVRRDFEAASTDLFMWRLHERAGLRVQASDSPLRPDTVVLMHLGLGHASIRIPCRVAYVIREPLLADSRTARCQVTPRTAKSGSLEQHGDGTISIAITAFSRPASRLARLGGPFTRRCSR